MDAVEAGQLPILNSRKLMESTEIHRRSAWAMTPEQRLELAERLHQHAMELLHASPKGYAAYVRRNLRQRRDRAECVIKVTRTDEIDVARSSDGRRDEPQPDFP